MNKEFENTLKATEAYMKAWQEVQESYRGKSAYCLRLAEYILKDGKAK